MDPQTQLKGTGIVLRDPKSIEFEEAVKLNFIVTNNEAEYEAVIAGMKLGTQLGAKNVVVYANSQLVAQQFGGTYEAKEASMIQYLLKERNLRQAFEHFKLHQIPREENERVDILLKFASAASEIKSRKITKLMSEIQKLGTFPKIKTFTK
ncbi:UNVERIFIED_CONTAM: Ribonuclease HI [Sesamum latifolium]|uniref:Ribonuclease HI n=1 Tax=Sesamum latifolium TaxID=2727402 RepID=A0AAW2VZZ2_9LAMI